MPLLTVKQQIGVDGRLYHPGQTVDSALVGDAAHVASLTDEGFFEPQQDDAKPVFSAPSAPPFASVAKPVEPEPDQAIDN